MFVFNSEIVTSDDAILGLAMHGYGTYTTMSVHGGYAKGLKLHLNRLLRDSSELFGLSPSEEVILDNVRCFLRRPNSPHSEVVRVTLFPNNFTISRPSDISDLNILVTGRVIPHQDKKPLRVLTVEASRTLPKCKSTNLMSAIHARRSAQVKGFDDALLTADGKVLEGASWNVLFLAPGKLIRPKFENDYLPGVTEAIVQKIALGVGLKVEERDVSIKHMNDFEGAFATNSNIGLKIIESINNVQFNSGEKILNLSQELREKYRQYPGEKI